MKSSGINAALYSIGILLGIGLCIAGILLEFPFWVLIFAPIAIITLFTILGDDAYKRASFAENGRISNLIYKAGRMKKGKGDPSALEKKMLAACEGSPEAWKGYRALGEMYIALGERSKARELLVKADKVLPDNSSPADRSRLWNTLGAIALASGRGEEAMEYCLKAAVIDPVYYRGAGLMYEFGWSLKPDFQKAEELYQRAVDAGSDTALANLYGLKWRISTGEGREMWQGYADYMHGCHCGRTQVAGLSSLRESARKGYAPAQFELGTMYQHNQCGEDAPTRRREAFKWLRASADQGFLPALHNLGILVQQAVIDPDRGDIYKPRIKGTLLYDEETVRYCAREGHNLILRAARAGYPPSSKL